MSANQNPQTMQPADVQVTPAPMEARIETRPNDMDSDPLLAALRENPELNGEGNELTPGATPENQAGAASEGQNQPTTPENQATTPSDPSKADGQVMIPKARLDEVLAERDQWKQTAQYQQGVLDTQTRMLQPGQTAIATQGNGQPSAPAAPAAPSFDDQIAKAENDKLSLAEKYDQGEISYKELQEQTVALDRNIRSLVDQRYEARVAEATRAATTQSTQAMLEAEVQREGNALKAANPMVAEIDNHPNSKGIWTMINGEALQAVQAKGINPLDGSLASRMALMQEKVALANKYGPTLTGKPAPTGSNPTQTAQPATPGQPLSPIAQARMDKMAVANNQPPVSGVIGSTGNSNEITDDQVMAMSQDQLADLIARNPAFARKFTGI